MVLAFLILHLINWNGVRADSDWTTIPFPSASTAPPQPTLTSSDDISLLYNCAPLGLDFCSFHVQGNSGVQSYSFIVGSPLSNCFGGTYPLDSDITVSFTASDTWSVDLNVGIPLGPLALSSHDSWSSTKSRTFSQGMTIHVPSDQQGALIALVNYNVTSGNMKVGSTVVSPVYSNQPTGQLVFSVQVIGCDQTFDANTTSPSPASPSGALRTPALSSIFYVSVILVGMAYVL